MGVFLVHFIPSQCNLYGYNVLLDPRPYSIEAMIAIHCTDDGQKKPETAVCRLE